jgi:hypothetical protein
MSRVYLSDFNSIGSNSKIRDYLVSASEYDDFCGVVGESYINTEYLNLEGNLNTTVKWLLEELESSEYDIDGINISSSSLELSPVQFIELWKSVGNIPRLNSKNARFVTGKGCNSFISSLADAARDVRFGLSNVVVCISIEMHPPNLPRMTDYGFFGDAVTVVIVSGNQGSILLSEYNSKSVFKSADVLPYKNFVNVDFGELVSFNTLNLFSHLNTVKYAGLLNLMRTDFKPHCYSDDPITNFFGGRKELGIHLLHAESPPGHIDSLLITVT